MSDDQFSHSQTSDDPVAEPEESPLAAYDAVMGPYLGQLGGIGLVSAHGLLQFAQTLRGALMALTTGAGLPEPGEAHDAYGDQLRAQKAARDEAALPPKAEAPNEIEPEPAVPADPASEPGYYAEPPPPPPPADPVVTTADLAPDAEPPIA
jgi:hypothetical protein